MVDGYTKKQEQQFDMLHQLFGWNAAIISNSSGNLKRPLTLDKLLKGKKKQQLKTRDEADKEMKDLLNKFGVDSSGKKNQNDPISVFNMLN